MKEFKIPVYRFEGFEKKISRYNKKATKLSLPLITLTELRRETLSIGYRRDSMGQAYGPEMFLEFVFIAIDGQAPFINGFSFIASIDHLSGGNVIRRFDINYPLSPSMIEKLSFSHCDHCKRKGTGNGFN